MEQETMTETNQVAQRGSWFKRTLDTESMRVVYTFEDGETVAFGASDFKESINKQALLSGLGIRTGQGVNKADTLTDAKAALKEAIDQLKAGDWSRGPAPNPANKLALAYVQLAKEANKVLTIKAAKEQIAAKETAEPGWAAKKMAEEKFQSAYARSQSVSDTTLDDIG